MKLSLINILAVLFLIFFWSCIIFNWDRVLSPQVPLKQNIEFSFFNNTKSQYDTYTVVLQYCYNVKPNDTLRVLYSHPPSTDDLFINSWFCETQAFYAPDNSQAKEYLFVCNIQVLTNK